MNIYIIKTEGQELFKVGIAENVQKRLIQISTNSPFKLEVIFEMNIENSHYIEQLLHQKYKEYNTNNEWFKLDVTLLSELKKDIIRISTEVTPKESLINWLNEYKSFFSLRAIEKELNIPTDTLQKFSQGKQGIPNKWIPTLYDFFKEMFGKL